MILNTSDRRLVICDPTLMYFNFTNDGAQYRYLVNASGGAALSSVTDWQLVNMSDFPSQVSSPLATKVNGNCSDSTRVAQ